MAAASSSGSPSRLKSAADRQGGRQSRRRSDGPLVHRNPLFSASAYSVASHSDNEEEEEDASWHDEASLHSLAKQSPRQAGGGGARAACPCPRPNLQVEPYSVQILIRIRKKEIRIYLLRAPYGSF